jgi:hypothetical protein
VACVGGYGGSDRIAWIISQHYEGVLKALNGELRRTTSNICSDDYQLVIVRRIPQTFGLGISFRLKLELNRLYAPQWPKCQ